MKKIEKILNYVLIAFVSFLAVFAVFNSFPTKPYISIANKWFLGREVPAPIDYKLNELRKIDIDLLAPKEINENGEFYWLQLSGDLLTLTNRNFKAVTGVLTFDLRYDPCKISREVMVGTQKETLIVTTKAEPTSVLVDFTIESNSSIFLSIVSTPKEICRIQEELNRNFMAQLTNIGVQDLRAE
jgi:hypothetical protein